jgi:hypothetical protein
VRRTLISSLAALCWFALSAPLASGSPITNTFGLLAPDSTITFSEHVLPSESPVTNEYADLGVLFDRSLYYNTQPVFFPTESFANFDFSGALQNPASIVFLQPVTALNTQDGIVALTELHAIFAAMPSEIDCGEACPSCMEVSLQWLLDDDRVTATITDRCWRSSEALQPLRASVERLFATYKCNGGVLGATP